MCMGRFFLYRIVLAGLWYAGRGVFTFEKIATFTFKLNSNDRTV